MVLRAHLTMNDSAIHSICVSDAEAAALDARRLTQLRRPVRPQPSAEYTSVEPKLNSFEWLTASHPRQFRLSNPIRCPFGEPGDMLWVRETWAVTHAVARSDDPIDPARDAKLVKYRAGEEESYSWRTPVTMPRWASRMTLRIKSVRPERLQAMKWPDYFAAGSPVGDVTCGACREELCLAHGGAQFWVRTQWDKVYGRSLPWTTNPWVWVLEVENPGES